MASMSFLNIAALILTLFSLSLNQAQATSAASASRGGFFAPALVGLCAAVRKHGYKCLEYQVTTSDGYILTVHRIPEGRAGRRGPRPQPVLLQHGLLMDGMIWVANPPKQSLAMILADKGFDVWISNTRGTRYSRRHRLFHPTHPKFWHWTWDDLIIHELPSIIGLIFKRTRTKIHYVGHSMGTLVALTSLSQGKMINVKSAALLSPIAYLSHLKTEIVVVAARAFLGELSAIFGMAEFNPRADSAAKFLESLCVILGVDCKDLKITALTGNNCCLNETIIQNFIEKEPQPTSTRNLIHLSQAIRHGFLCKYDYGNFVENMHHYGQLTPPFYNLSNIPRDFPLFISYGGEDILSDVTDVGVLLDDLKIHHKQKLKVQYIKKYAHLDFVLGVNAKDIVYNQILDFFTRHK